MLIFGGRLTLTFKYLLSIIIDLRLWIYLFIYIIQWSSINSTSDNSKTCLTQTKFHGPCLGDDNLLGIVFFSHEKKIKFEKV